MMSYPIQTVASAPEGSRATLSAVQKAMGFVPNLLGVMASAPPLLKTYVSVGALFDETSFTPTERQVVMLTTSHENDCSYCMAAHTVLSDMQKVPADVVQAVRDGAPLADRKLEGLRKFTAVVVESRGLPTVSDISAFKAAGYGETQVLEVVLGVGLKTMSNYVNHIAGTPLDDAFGGAAWTKRK